MAFFAIALALLLEQVRPLAEDHPAVQSLRRWLRLVGRNVDAGGLQGLTLPDSIVSRATKQF